MRPDERVRRFLDAWESAPSRGDVIYGLGVHHEEETRDLLASDLRALLACPRDDSCLDDTCCGACPNCCKEGG